MSLTTECHAMVCGRAVCAAESLVRAAADGCAAALQASGGELGVARGARGAGGAGGAGSSGAVGAVGAAGTVG